MADPEDQDPPGLLVELEAHQAAAEPVPVWCPRCSLPSALEVSFHLVDRATLRPLALFTTTLCVECEWTETPEVDLDAGEGPT